MPWDNSTAHRFAASEHQKGASSSAKTLGIGSSDSPQRSTVSQNQATDAQQADAGQDVATRPAKAKPKSGLGRGSKQIKSKGPMQEVRCFCSTALYTSADANFYTAYNANHQLHDKHLCTARMPTVQVSMPTL